MSLLTTSCCRISLKRYLVTVGLLLVSLLAGWAQTPSDRAKELVYEDMPSEGILLDKGWKFRAGDNPAWAGAQIDDHDWVELNPNLPPRASPQLASTGIGWARLHLRLGKRIQRRALFLLEDQFGAADIYLNGRLIQRYGTVSDRPDKVRPARLDYFNALELPLDGKADQVLAVRLAVWPPLRHFNNYLVPYQFKFILMGKPELFGRFAEWIPLPIIYALLAGIFLLIAILHLTFWWYNPTLRANLYFAAYALAEMIAFISGVVLWDEIGMQPYLILMLLMLIFIEIGNVFAVKALYSLFDFPRGVRYKALCVAFFVCLVLFLGMSSGFWAYGAFMILVTFEQVQLTLRALRQNKRGARIIATGFICALLIMVGLVALNYWEVITYSMYLYICFSLLLGTQALAISLFLAREFALDRRLLQVKLAEVQALSAQTLAQEQERQHLLANQNETLERQVAERTAELQRSLDHLRSTQAQLIQKEKMASLGELTAGIAHEIQNPLNFVTNFSEVSAELVGELEEEQHSCDRNRELETDLLTDLKDNLQKISHHGQRASRIVRGMLDHSRTSTGEVQLTHLNVLCEEYLRLAYHGLRAKDHTFNCELITQLDAQLSPVPMIAQDIGRVLLNLLSNAFYAVRERQKQCATDYRPVVGIRTEKKSGGVEIRIHDNGTGMGEGVKQKIFQPFFTTKPTGEGTGLGLSLSYDIVTKGHKGVLTVESALNQGTEFRIWLPITHQEP